MPFSKKGCTYYVATLEWKHFAFCERLQLLCRYSLSKTALFSRKRLLLLYQCRLSKTALFSRKRLLLLSQYRLSKTALFSRKRLLLLSQHRLSKTALFSKKKRLLLLSQYRLSKTTPFSRLFFCCLCRCRLSKTAPFSRTVTLNHWKVCWDWRVSWMLRLLRNCEMVLISLFTVPDYAHATGDDCRHVPEPWFHVERYLLNPCRHVKEHALAGPLPLKASTLQSVAYPDTFFCIVSHTTTHDTSVQAGHLEPLKRCGKHFALDTLQCPRGSERGKFDRLIY